MGHGWSPPFGPVKSSSVQPFVNRKHTWSGCFVWALLRWRFVWCSESNCTTKQPRNKRALQFLEATTQFVSKFKNHPSLAEKYSAAINEYFNLGHARKLSSEESINGPTGRTWWLAHHPVFNVNKPWKLRVVFDAATTFQEVSLNTELLKVPDLLTSLVGVLLWFRQYLVAIIANIVKMFYQVRVREVEAANAM